jgi:DNA segregation ATPase FtsK/SpoIIIE, S-DNA-T family
MEVKEKRRNWASELTGFGCMVLALLLVLSLISFQEGQQEANWLGLIGHGLGWFLTTSFGLGSFLVVSYLGWWGWRLLTSRQPERPKLELISFGVLLIATCLLLTVLATAWPTVGAFFRPLVHTSVVTFTEPIALRELRDHLGGLPLTYLYVDLPFANLQQLLSGTGTTLIASTVALVAAITLFQVHPLVLLKKWWVRARSSVKEAKKRAETQPKISLPNTQLPKASKVKTSVETPPPAPPSPKPKSSPRPAGPYTLPEQELLADGKRIDPSSLKKDLQRQAETLEKTLENFGIEARVGEINCGPTIASFEVHPSVGVKVQRIKALERDIALNLEAHSIRIIAPIPGKAAVGIEIPSPKPQGVSFKEMMAAYKSQEKQCAIPLLLGKAVSGKPVISDLAKMPHLIIAGATGSGKSVCVNAIIMSILLNRRPDEVRLLMVDPKKVELTPYSELPHMLAPVITEPHEACLALNWLVKEMEKRYEILRAVGARNVTAFNQRERDSDFEDSLDIEIPERMPFLVGIVDELADLMMASSSDIETPITRIAQMARAVGIHLILATQRPSREVITGLIKANFPTRIAFKVANRINSQIILDETGAETLLGNGDMLFLPPGSSTLIRAQGTFVSDADIQKVIRHIRKQAPTCYEIESFRQAPGINSGLGVEVERDSLYDEAFGIVTHTGVASTTFLQRKLKVGYARAASIMDQLEEHGVIGPQDGSRPRRVLVKPTGEPRGEN